MHQPAGEQEKNRQGLSTLKIRVKRGLNIFRHRPAVDFRREALHSASPAQKDEVNAQR
jgi:hypothetical protein